MRSSRWLLRLLGVSGIALAAALPAYGGPGPDAHPAPRGAVGRTFLYATSLTKVGASGQIYSWTKGTCWGDAGTWSTSIAGRVYIWSGGYESSTAEVMRGMGLRRDVLLRGHSVDVAKRLARH